MRKLLLTSAGFSTGEILTAFLGLFDKEPCDIKALFVPTAANNPGRLGVQMLEKCMNDLLNAGILSEHIDEYDMQRNMGLEELREYDTIYFAGGSSVHLLERINDTGFYGPLTQYVEQGGVYVGVSAGSIVATNNLPNNLGYINCTLDVHRPIGTKNGPLDTSANPHVELADNQAILIVGDQCEIL